MIIRDERPEDCAAIRQVVKEAFARASRSNGTEAAVIDELRAANALAVSIVADEAGRVLGHAAVSPVSIEGVTDEWFGLGPVAVLPDYQGQGVGAALIKQALIELKELDAAGCVVLGEPDYYSRFGFRHDPRLTYADVPPPYFQVLSFKGSRPTGPVAYHNAFNIPST